MAEAADVATVMGLLEQLVPGVGAERREHARTTVKGDVLAVLEMEGGVPCVVRLRDISRSGVGIVSENGVRVGEKVTVSFRLGDGNVRAKCRVANCRAESVEGRWIVGLAFEEVKRTRVEGAAGVPEGEIVSGMELVGGADRKHVDEVIMRLSTLVRVG